MPNKFSSPVKYPDKQPYRGFFYQLQVIGVVAVLLATFFTIWTPGRPILSSTGSSARTTTPQLTKTPVSSNNSQKSGPKIGIVAGHWKNEDDPGTVCSDGLQEVDINLKIATLVKNYLVSEGFSVDLLAEFDPNLQSYLASALVSIHADSCEFINNQATGYKIAASIATHYTERAKRLTDCIMNRYASTTGLSLHSGSITPDMTSYHSFGEIDPNTPAIIIEAGFMNLDRDVLEHHPDLVALGITQGIICFMRNESIETPAISPTP
jgi:N-acetylmuramoyl-L-alanine amidase